MLELIAAFFQVFTSGASVRANCLITGIGAAVLGIALMVLSGGVRQLLYGGALLTLGGVALTLVGIKLGGADRGAKKNKPPPDEWKPPDAEEIRKVVGGP